MAIIPATGRKLKPYKHLTHTRTSLVLMVDALLPWPNAREPLVALFTFFLTTYLSVILIYFTFAKELFYCLMPILI